VDWIGLTGLHDGGYLWFDFTVRAADLPVEHPILANGTANGSTNGVHHHRRSPSLPTGS
jgi:hypothetical protein